MEDKEINAIKTNESLLEQIINETCNSEDITNLIPDKALAQIKKWMKSPTAADISLLEDSLIMEKDS